MSEQIHDPAFLDGDAGKAEAITEVRREAALLKTGALQNAILTAPISRVSPLTRRASFRSSMSAPSACWATRPPMCWTRSPRPKLAQLFQPFNRLGQEAGGTEGMDINLPDISGFEALKILRGDAATAHIPVVALSANAMPRDIEKGLKAGFLRFLTKPIKVNEFMDALDVALDLAEKRVSRSQ